MRLDLNLYTVFEAIYNEGNLTKAANTLHITQPAISHSLAKLREHFDDALFIRQGHRMLPSPLAERLIVEIRQALHTLKSAHLSSNRFDPASAKTTFKIGLRDVLESTCLPPLMSLLQEQAPNVSIISLRHDRKTMEHELASGELDMVIDVALPVTSQLQQQRVIAERLCVLAKQEHPALKTVLDIDTYIQQKHVMASYRSSGMAIEDLELNRYGLSRNVVLRCQHYYAASQVVSHSELLLTMPESYARLLAKDNSQLEVFDFPIQSPSVDVHIYSHTSRETDPELKWLKEVFMTLALGGT